MSYYLGSFSSYRGRTGGVQYYGHVSHKSNLDRIISFFPIVYYANFSANNGPNKRIIFPEPPFVLEDRKAVGVMVKGGIEC